MKVIKPWLFDLPLRMQSTVLLSLRGPDGCTKEGPHKQLIREFRYVVLVPAFPKDIFPKEDDWFMGSQTGITPWTLVEEFAANHDHYPHHWLLHFIHAAEIVGQFHPDDDIRIFWLKFYLRMCDTMHMRAETANELSERLQDPPWIAKDDQAAAIIVNQVLDRPHKTAGGQHYMMPPPHDYRALDDE